MGFFYSNHFESNHFASNYLAGVTKVEDDQGGGPSGASRKKRRKRGEGWGREREILERSLQPKEVEEPIEPAIAPQVDVADGSQLKEEELYLEGRIADLERLYLEGVISKAERDKQIKRQDDALKVILMALELDKRMYYEIIM